MKLKAIRDLSYAFCFLPSFLYLLQPTICYSQNEIPLGTWRMHLSYKTINSIAIGTEKVFGAAENGIMIFDRTDNSINTYTKLNGLNGISINTINYNQKTDQLLVAYKDGALDVIKGNEVFNFDRLKNTDAITGSKKINHISFRSGLAYLSTDYGLVLFDLNSNEIKETWRDIGINGAKLKIIQSTFLGDSIFLATEKGIIAGNINDNLLDYNKWRRFNQGDLNVAIQSINTFNQKVFVSINNSGIYYYENGSWIKETFLQDVIFRSLSANDDDLIITANLDVWRLNKQNVLTQIVSPSTQPLFAAEDSSGKLWIGDSQKGIVSDFGGSFSSYIPNGPVNATSARLKYQNKNIYLLPGGYTESFEPIHNDSGFDSFTNGVWTHHPLAITDITDMDFINNKTYVSSFGYGLLENPDQGGQLFNEKNSTLSNSNPPEKSVYVSAIEHSTEGLWVANYDGANPLHLLNNSGIWKSFSFSKIESRYPTDLLVDLTGSVWITLSSNGGLIVFDKKNNKTAYFTNKKDLLGSLPGSAVTSIALDRDGYVWVGTDEGVAYFIDPYNVFSSHTDIIKPIFDNRFLLKSQVITAIAVDEGNRKWMGTKNGAWLFNSTGEKQIYNFTSDNSPLISNVIRDIEINPETGEVFFATDDGVVSFRGDATESSAAFQSIKIFPNPVLSEFNGTIGISGLATDALVKITDISGKLIWQTKANGGTATWNIKDVNGHRATSGIYLVFAATQDATESIVGKIAIVE